MTDRTSRVRLVGAAAVLVALAVIVAAPAWLRWANGGSLSTLVCGKASAWKPPSDCIAGFPIRDVDLSRAGPVALSPDGTLLLVAGRATQGPAPGVLVALRTDDGHEAWRLPLASKPLGVAIWRNGGRVAVWSQADRVAVQILSIPDGKRIAEIPYDDTYPVMAHFDVAFADDGDAVAYGSISARRSFRFADGTIASSPANGPLCSGLVGQGNIPRLMTRDFRLMIYFRKAGLGAGRIESPRNWCNTAFVVLSPPNSTPRADMVFAALSPSDDRLATVYETARRRDFIEIRDVPAEPDAAVVPRILATLPVDGKVNYRIGWSADGRRLAAVADTAQGFQARIYRIR